MSQLAEMIGLDNAEEASAGHAARRNMTVPLRWRTFNSLNFQEIMDRQQGAWMQTVSRSAAIQNGLVLPSFKICSDIATMSSQMVSLKSKM